MQRIALGARGRGKVATSRKTSSLAERTPPLASTWTRNGAGRHRATETSCVVNGAASTRPRATHQR